MWPASMPMSWHCLDLQYLFGASPLGAFGLPQCTHATIDVALPRKNCGPAVAVSTTVMSHDVSLNF